MSVAVRITDWQRDKEQLKAIRHQVFVIEQDVPVELELDEYDLSAIHAIASSSDGTVIGTGRLLPSGKIGRMAVLAHYRGQGVGSSLLKLLTETCLKQLDTRPYLESQVHAIPFYEEHDYVAEGSIYLDAGIDHRLMKYKSPTNRE